MPGIFDPFGLYDDGPQQRSRPSFNAKDKEFLYKQQSGKCNGCESKLPMRNMTVDHIKPFSKGGSDKPSNLQLLCGSCNSMKGDGTQAQLKKKLAEKGIIRAKPAAKKTTQSTAKGKTATSAKKATSKAAKPKAKPARRPRTLQDELEDFTSFFR